MKLNKIYFLLLIIWIIYIIHPVLTNPWISTLEMGGDQEIHSVRTWHLANQIYNFKQIPSWNSYFLAGTSMLPLYAPLMFYLFAPLFLLFTPIIATKICWVLIAFTSAVFCFLLSKKVLKSEFKAIIATFIFVSFNWFYLLISRAWVMPSLTGMIFAIIVLYIYENLEKEQNVFKKLLFSFSLIICFLTHHTVGPISFVCIFMFMIYDYIWRNKKHILTLIPYFIFSIINVLFYVIPVFLYKQNYNAVIRQVPLKPPFLNTSVFYNIFAQNSIDFIVSIFFFISVIYLYLSHKQKKEKLVINRYIFASFFFLLFGFVFCYFVPEKIYGILFNNTTPYTRVLGIVSVMISISAVYGIYFFEKKFMRQIYNNKKNIISVIIILLFLSSFYRVSTNLSDEQYPDKGYDIPKSLKEFYKNISYQNEFFRIDDQEFLRFGSSVLLHKHGVLNGGPGPEATIHHFTLWSYTWQLLKTNHSINFAKSYGLASIKYFISKNNIDLPGFEKKCTYQYCILENKEFKPHIRLVPNIATIGPNKRPDIYINYLNILSQNNIDFDKIVLIADDKIMQTNYSNSVGNVVVNEDTKGGYFKITLNNITKPQYIVISENYDDDWTAKFISNNMVVEKKVYMGLPSLIVIPVEQNGVLIVQHNHKKIKKDLFKMTIVFDLIVLGYLFIKSRNNKR